MRRLRAISAVVRKEMILLLRYPTWIIQIIIWPLIMPLMYFFSALGYAGSDKSGFVAFQKVTGTSNFTGYIVVGTIMWMWVNEVMWSLGTYLREEQMRGTLESNWLCPINKLDLLLGASLINIIMNFIICFISIIEYKYIYGIKFCGSNWYWILLFFILMPSVNGLGILFASLVLWLKEAYAAVHIVRGIVMIFCGITFPIAIMPSWMQRTAKIIPFTYGISIARDLMINGKSLYSLLPDIGICLLQGTILIVLAIFCFKYTENKVKKLGAIGRF